MLNEQGYEIPDDTPVAIPARLRLPTSRAAQIQSYIRQELSRAAQEKGQETFDEANDLDVEEMQDFPMTEYERSGQFGMDDVMDILEQREREAALTRPPAEPTPVPKDEAAAAQPEK